jgi:hypothetical protein
MEILPIHEVRRARLRQLLDAHGGPAALARRVGLFQASYLTQLAGPTPTRNISEHTARRIEQALLLPDGWMDQPAADGESLPAQASPPTFRPTDGLDEARLREALAVLQAAGGAALPPERQAQLALALYEIARSGCPLTPALAARLINLVR